MAKCLVTGAAGFVGSHLSELLLAEGHTVVGVDSFIPYYPRVIKESNLSSVDSSPSFSLHEVDLRVDGLESYLKDVDVVFHLAAQAGLLKSWSDFDSYLTCNVQATQRLLEAVVVQDKRPHFINISTSSVYGRYATGDETSRLHPVSPYGITKLAAEHLCWAYAEKNALPVSIARLYSVYGPRQRPDMGYNIFIRSILNGEPITIFGDGEDSRSNTFVTDCARGIALIMEHADKSIGEIFNIGGGEEIAVNQVISLIEEFSGKRAITKSGPKRPGDQKRTMADIRKAEGLIGYRPTVSIPDGLKAQFEWQKKM